MTKLELVISGLAAIALVGLIVILGLDKDSSILAPIVTALISFVLGTKKDQIVQMIRR